MDDIEKRLSRWLAHLGPPSRRADPDQEFEWLVNDALEEIRKLRAQVRMNPPTVAQEMAASDGRMEANARLIAAAPEMYEALLAAKVVIEMMERPEGMGGRVNAALDKRLAQIDAAIAKAEAQK